LNKGCALLTTTPTKSKTANQPGRHTVLVHQ
jgi:hypothetical protein